MMMNERVMVILRFMRRVVYRLLDPFDALFLRLNRMSSYPPISLRRHVSCLGFLDGSGYEYVAYLRLLAGLKGGEKLLDMACGCGFLELALESHLWEGTVVGVDIHRPSISWCNKGLARRNPAWRFMHADIYNAAYWRKGSYNAAEWFDTFDQNDFDCVVAKSLFTHMLPDELTLYVRNLSSRTKPGGVCIFSFFLLNPEQQQLDTQRKSSIHFIPVDDIYSVRTKIAPTAAVAYSEDYVRSLLQSQGWENVTLHYGYWSGRSDGMDYQDLIIATRK
jgi:SAM-dependent methyltransferase